VTKEELLKSSSSNQKRRSFLPLSHFFSFFASRIHQNSLPGYIYTRLPGNLNIYSTQNGLETSISITLSLSY